MGGLVLTNRSLCLGLCGISRVQRLQRLCPLLIHGGLARGSAAPRASRLLLELRFEVEGCNMLQAFSDPG